MNPELRYFREEALVSRYQVDISASIVLAVPADPMRYAITLPNVAGLDLYMFTGPTYQFGTNQVHVPDGSGPVVLTEDVLGELVRREWHAVDGQGNSLTVAFLTVSYCSYRYEQMRRYVHARLSQLISL